ncbi:MAG: tetratricopeptide repeat protein [Rhodoferax sp.]
MNFWLMFTVLVLLALVFVLLPLRRLNTRSAQAPKAAVAPRTTRNRWAPGVLVVVLPLVTLGLYSHLGAPSILGADQMLQARGQHDVDSMMAALEAKLKANPDDADALYVLGRAYLALQRNAEAEAVLAKAAKLAPKEARMLSQYAEVLALNRNGELQGTTMQLIEQALELDYQDEKALELAGLAAYQRLDWAQAVHFWRRLLKRLPADSEFHQDMTRAVQDAEEKSELASGLGERAKLQPPIKTKNPH